MWISSDKCKSGPGGIELENVLFIALERWEWQSPEAYCKINQFRTTFQNVLELVTDLCKQESSASHTEQREEYGREHVAASPWQEDSGVSQVPGVDCPRVWRCSVRPCWWVCEFLLTMTKSEAAYNGLTQWKRPILCSRIWQSYSFLP